MNIYYLESSVLLSWLLGETTARSLGNLLESAQLIGTSRLTLIETKRALIRYEHRCAIKPVARQKIFGYLEKMAFDWNIMEISPVIEQGASRIFPIEPVRSLDAIHLATAMEFLKVAPDLQCLTLDHRIIANCEALGMLVYPL